SGSGKLRLYQLETLVWNAGFGIGSGASVLPLLDLMPFDAPLSPNAATLAEALITSTLIPRLRPRDRWVDEYVELAPAIQSFLEALQDRLRTPGIARSIQNHLESQALGCSSRPRPFTLRRTHAVSVNVGTPLSDIIVPAGIERVHAEITFAGHLVGSLLLPAFDGRVTASVLADAIAAEHAWALLEIFFQRTLYPRLSVDRQGDSWSIRRGAVTLASQAFVGEPTIDWTRAHDLVGWTVLLQEVWGRPEDDGVQLYRLSKDDAARLELEPEAGDADWEVVEVSAPLRDLRARRQALTLIFTVGGAAVMQKTLAAHDGRISTDLIRVALTRDAGFELCRACVREAIIGLPVDAAGPLRQRLSERAAQRRAREAAAPRLPGFEFHPVSVAAREELGSENLLWSRRLHEAVGTSASRRYQLPRELADEVVAIAQAGGEPALVPDRPPLHLLTAPELVWRRPGVQPKPPTSAPRTPAVADALEFDTAYGRLYFEELFSAQADPWKYTSPYEQTKYAQTLGLLPRKRFKRALELACAEGHFTVQLAPRTEQLVATDISEVALGRTRQRCAAYSNVRYAQLDLLRDSLPGQFDLIVCSEVLYYSGSISNLRAIARKFEQALAPGGYVVHAHAHLVVDDPKSPGFDWDHPFGAKRIGEIIGSTRGLRLVRELRTPLYRIQVFQKARPLTRWLPQRGPQRRYLSEQPTPLEPHV
ncbi:MAG TPA: SAM-dependent methyltransferase, partial [Candidatus Synoicihabitans sp.]|nr:SAM-dependent methyltransferase [Candidatus Synoicihabitans sp.]